MIDIVELDKKLTVTTAWNTKTEYKPKVIVNANTRHQLEIMIGKEIDNNYKGYLLEIDNGLENDKFVIGIYKKGEEV